MQKKKETDDVVATKKKSSFYLHCGVVVDKDTYLNYKWAEKSGEWKQSTY